jgi:hypothetical protein
MDSATEAEGCQEGFAKKIFTAENAKKFQNTTAFLADVLEQEGHV